MLLRWERDGRRVASDPPFLYPDSGATDATRAANLVAALVHASVQTIGGLPIDGVRVGELLDVDLARSFMEATGIPAGTLRLGFDQLRSDGYRMVVEYRDEDRIETVKVHEVWPTPQHDTNAREDV